MSLCLYDDGDLVVTVFAGGETHRGARVQVIANGQLVQLSALQVAALQPLLTGFLAKVTGTAYPEVV